VNCSILVVVSVPVIHHTVYMRTRSVVHLQCYCRTSIFFVSRYCVSACFYS